MVRTLQLVTTRRPFFDQQVAALERNGVDCSVVTVPGVSGERSPLSYLRFYARTLREAVGAVDLVHANYGTTAPAALAQPRRPVVLSLWGSDLFGRYGRVSEACADHSDAVVVMSDEMADELDRDCHVVPHGVDTEAFAPRPRADARDSLGWATDAYHVLFPYDPSRTVKDYPRAATVVERAREAVDRPVELHPVHGVPHDRVPVYLNAADALLLTSKREGSPNAVKEALACETHVVATPVGDVPDLLDGVPGTWLAGSDDELVAGLLAAFEDDVAVDASDRVAEFSLDRMATDLLAVYESVLGREVVAGE